MLQCHTSAELVRNRWWKWLKSKQQRPRCISSYPSHGSSSKNTGSTVQLNSIFMAAEQLCIIHTFSLQNLTQVSLPNLDQDKPDDIRGVIFSDLTELFKNHTCHYSINKPKLITNLFRLVKVFFLCVTLVECPFKCM